MISNAKHKKHGNISRTPSGHFGVNEVALLGTTCEAIQQIVSTLRSVFPKQNIAFVDADHDETQSDFHGTHMQTKSDYFQFSTKKSDNFFEQRIHLSQSDLIIVNGNHFEAKSQIVICNPQKAASLIKRKAQLTNVCALILPEDQTEVPSYIKDLIPEYENIPSFRTDNSDKLHSFFSSNFFKPAELRALILAGGKSTRMGMDKALINHHSVEQYLFLKRMFDDLGLSSFVSCRAEQSAFYKENGCEVIEDAVLSVGPLGGIVSAFMKYPDSAWLVVACDIPLLDQQILNELISNRRPQSAATCFRSPYDGLPEPLIAIWEPKSYMRIMEFIAMGYDCPRKVLINAESYFFESESPEKLANVNTPEDLAKLKS